MKLLFDNNQPDVSSKELKDLLGYVDADLKFKNLRPDIITATKDVINLISIEVYDYVADLYLPSMVKDFDDPNYLLVRAVQLPIATNGYMLYAPSNDLSHTNDGRKMRNDEHEKQAFEWQLDRDNKVQEKRYYRSLDDLIYLLDTTNITVLKTLWHASDAYKLSKSNFVNTVRDFNLYYNIESSLLLMKIAPGLSECERREIAPRIGSAKYLILKNSITEPTPALSAADVLLLDLCKEFEVNYALAWALPRFSVTLFPEGVLQYQNSDRMSTQAKKPALFNEPELARQTFANNAKRLAIEIENHVKPALIADETIAINPIIISGNGHFSA